jgi:magnesium transporter
MEVDDAMKRLMAYDGQRRCDVEWEALPRLLHDQQTTIWIDVQDEPAAEIASLFREVFDFHPLAIDDALEEAHVPKLDNWDRYLYLDLHTVGCTTEDCETLFTEELDIFLGTNYLVTYHAVPMLAVDRVWTMCERDGRYMVRGAAHLLYRLTDDLVADYLSVVDTLDEAIDSVEDQVFAVAGSEALLSRIFTLKRALLRLRRITSAHREVLNRLARRDVAVIPEGEAIYFRDVYDHLVRIYDVIESLRDLTSGVLDSYLSVVNNRMNEVMKVLTVFTTLFMPISFLAGFFGMNFFQPALALPAWTSGPVFIGLLLLMILVPLSMFLWMRHRAWT